MEMIQRLLALGLMILAMDLSGGCCRRDDESPISGKIIKYAKSHCGRLKSCRLPENLFFRGDGIDHIMVLENLYDMNDVLSLDIDLNSIDLMKGTGTLKAHRFWLFLKGRKLLDFSTEEDLLMCDIPFPVGIHYDKKYFSNNSYWRFDLYKSGKVVYAGYNFGDDTSGRYTLFVK